jgi:hypothetical protein
MLDVTVQCSEDADPGKHRRPAFRPDQDQRLHGRVPFQRFVLGLWKLRDVVAGILEHDELATVRQRD